MADARLETLSDWWASTKSPRDMFRPDYQNVENDRIIRESTGVDPALLAADLGVSEVHIRAYQRRLGVREITGNPPRKVR